MPSSPSILCASSNPRCKNFFTSRERGSKQSWSLRMIHFILVGPKQENRGGWEDSPGSRLLTALNKRTFGMVRKSPSREIPFRVGDRVRCRVTSHSLFTLSRTPLHGIEQPALSLEVTTGAAARCMTMNLFCRSQLGPAKNNDSRVPV